jgi:hypothetical protein
MKNQKNKINPIYKPESSIFEITLGPGVQISTIQYQLKQLLHYLRKEDISKLIDITGDSEGNLPNCSATFPLFFESQNIRHIPNKVKRTIERYCSAPLLKEIHEDKDVAVELCLLFLSNLSNAYYITESGWKRLYSPILEFQLGRGYTKIIKCLLQGTSKGPIIERSDYFTIGQESYRYRLTEPYRNKGVKLYEFQTPEVKNRISKIYFKQLSEAIDNPISNNLIKSYQLFELPSMAEIKREAKRLVKEGYITKKGKILTFQNKHSKDYWKDADSRSFVEENIELFKRLTEHGYLIPIIGDENSGGRVTDSFNLMPSWIRRLIKINGKPIQEADYSALHPNLAMKIYGGEEKYITHEKVAQELNMDLKKVKIQHLSFFNHEWKNMYYSPLMEYYRKDYVFMGNIHKDKAVDHKITSKKLFKLEVDIMTSVIQKLNQEGIYVMYVYDALYSCEKTIDRVREVMNEEIIKHGVHTKAK